MANDNSSENYKKDATEIEFLKAQIRKLDVEVDKLKSSSKPGVIWAKFIGLGLGLVPLIIGYSFLAKPFFEKSKLEKEVSRLKIQKSIYELDSIKREKVLLASTNSKLKSNVDSIEDVLSEYLREKDSLRIALDQQKENCDKEKVDILGHYEEIIKKLSFQNQQSNVSNTGRTDTALIKATEKLTAQKVQIEKDIRDSEEEIRQNRQKSSGKEGWIYVGHYEKGTFGKTSTLNVNHIPVAGEDYKTIVASYLREDRPKFPLYMRNAPKVILQLPMGTKVKILDVEPDVGLNKVWVKVRVMGQE